MQNALRPQKSKNLSSPAEFFQWLRFHTILPGRAVRPFAGLDRILLSSYNMMYRFA